MKVLILAKAGKPLTDYAGPPAVDAILAADAEARAKVREDFGIEYASEGGYAAEVIDFHGLQVVIENPVGSVRAGIDPDGNLWIVDVFGGRWDWPKARGIIKSIAEQERILVGMEPRSNSMRMGAHADELAPSLADADAVREGRDPSNPQGLQWEQTENGPRVTTAAERAAAAKGRGAGGSGMSIGDQVALLRLQRDINRDTATDTRNAQLDERAQRAQDETLRQNLLKNVREDPGTLINTRLGGLFGRDLSNPEDLAALDEFFNSEEGRVISNELTERFRRTNREGNLAFGLGMTSNPTFADLRPSRAPGLSGRYVVEGDELFGAQLAPEDLGLSAESLDLLTRYYARRRAQNDR